MTERLAGKVAVITGGGSGIGLASTRLFLREGAKVAIVDSALAEAQENWGTADDPTAPLLLKGDVGDKQTVADHAREVAERFGGFDILLACAGWSTGRGVLETSIEDWNAVINTNLTGSFLWSCAAVASMRARGGGSIILIGSQLAFAGGRSNAPYLAAKGGIAALARCMAVDYATDGIRVNTIVPGAIDTPLLDRGFQRAADPAAARARSIARHPLGRLGTPEEVAQTALFLAGDESSFTTGSCLMVDGGWLAA